MKVLSKPTEKETHQGVLGSIGNLASAATVAASSFQMTVTNPQHFIDMIPPERWELLNGRSSLKGKLSGIEPDWVEPASPVEATPESELSDNQSATALTQHDDSKDSDVVAAEAADQPEKKVEKLIHGKIQRLGDFVDTDAVRLL